MNKTFLIAAALAMLLIQGCATQPPVDVYLSDIRSLPSTPLEQRVALAIRLQNPSDNTISASGVSLALDINGGRFARGVSSEPFELPALGETTVTIDASISVIDAVRRAMSAARNQAVRYELTGRVFTNGLRSVRFRREGELSAQSFDALSASSGAQPIQPSP
ncbi:MAG: LEA type 2 family protein [Pseudomonadaceae bacterium]|nr:LEA type 2 family protein [Pseudomonadaceae bacterium]